MNTPYMFQVVGNTGTIGANTSSGNTQLTVGTASGVRPGAYYLVNDGPNTAFVNFDYTGSANALVATAAQDGRGVCVAVDSPVVVNLNQNWNPSPGNLYVTAITADGTATVWLTPVAQ